MIPIIGDSLRWREASPSTLFGGDAGFFAAAEPQDSDYGGGYRKYEEETAEQPHGSCVQGYGVVAQASRSMR
jgi:hypothetical protein